MKRIIIKSILFILIFPFYSFSESIKVIPGKPPVMISTKTSINKNDDVSYGPIYSTSGNAKANITGFIYGSASYGGSAINCSANYMAKWKCIDGYCGITVNSSTSDVIYIPSGNVWAKFAIAYDNLTKLDGSVSFNISSPPSFSKAIQSSSNVACFSQSTNPNYFYINGNARTDFTASLDWYVYAAKSAQAKQISTEQISITGVFGASGGSELAIPANVVNIIAPLECTISAPATVDFGLVNITGVPSNGLLASKMQGINISCSSEDATITAEKMKISFEGGYSGTNWGRLDIKNSTGAIMGYIRGRYLDDGGLCAGDSANEVGFNGTSAIKTINNVGVGSTNIPITWSLCNNGAGLLGEGSAQATVNINWD